MTSIASTTALSDERRIEFLRRNYQAYNRCDFDAVIEMAHPDIVLVRAGRQGEIRGRAAVRAWLEPDAFESQRLDPIKFRLTADKAMVHVRGTLRGAGSGIEMEVWSWAVWTFDAADRVTRIEVFLDHEHAEAERALRAA